MVFRDIIRTHETLYLKNFDALFYRALTYLFSIYISVFWWYAHTGNLYVRAIALCKCRQFFSLSADCGNYCNFMCQARPRQQALLYQPWTSRHAPDSVANTFPFLPLFHILQISHYSGRGEIYAIVPLPSLSSSPVSCAHLAHSNTVV